jgi:hypothetical protein
MQQLKRQHSAEPLNNGAGPEGRKPSKSATPSATSTPKIGTDLSTTPPLVPGASTAPLIKTSAEDSADDAAFVGSPMKKQRASLAAADAETIKRRLGSGLTGNIGEILGSASEHTAPSDPIGDMKKEGEDEEL